MKKIINYLALFIVSLTVACFSNVIGESSQKGEVMPAPLMSEVMKLAKEKHSDSVFIGLKSANNEYQYLRLSTGNQIDFSYISPNGKSTRWDFYFAKDKDDFEKKDKFLARPETYELKAEDHFGIRYTDGEYRYIKSSAFYVDSDLLGQTTDLKVTGLLNPNQLIPKVKQELKRLHGNDDINNVAFSLQSTGYALPLNTSWTKQKGIIGPVWEVAAMLKDGKRGAVVFIAADTGEIVQETRGVAIH